ncbi:hypothetical protein D9756_008733 [Leucocoprinus leucothites]|uniref:Oxidoreductase-like domain-containing protein n=1 Tax=Leucocoprinus leucothites TaxID=201217 RepID=A0A8H5D006_9AGAR|nr:hypothetical protein D9756_008733 [Leucoagaricus leucothites]
MPMSLTIFHRCTSQVLFHDVQIVRRLGFADHTRSREPLSPAVPKNRIKSPTRGGRNLRDRYLTLEKSLRGKEALTRSRHDQHQSSAANLSTNPTLTTSSKIPTFKGFIIPLEPVPPESDECCMSGCAVCVYDLYEESLEAYNEAVEDLRTKLVAVNIPEDEWPKHIRTRRQTGSNTQPAKFASVVMSAFEEMERRLKEKHPAPGTNATDFNTPGS